MNERLKNMLKNAYENVPYYRNLFNELGIDISSICDYEKFQQIPLLNKEILRKNQADFINDNFNVEDLGVGFTSGSTGEVLKVYWSKDDVYRADIELWRMRKRFGIVPMSRKCALLFDTELKNNKNIFFINGNSININTSLLTKENFYITWEKINEFRSEYIVSTPSLILMFLRLAKDSNCAPNNGIKYIELCGEYLSDAVRDEIQAYFKKAIIVNHYGCRETRLIGIECEKGNMHYIDQNVFVEFLMDGKPVKPGEKGKVYVTSLNNYAMPLIRYELGDIGCFTNYNCQCGDDRRVIKIFAGRDNDYIKMRDNSKVSSVVFWGAVNYVNLKLFNCIISFSIIQKDYERFLINFITKENINKKEIEKYFEKYICQFPQNEGKWSFEYKYCDEIEINKKSGKLRYFSSELSLM